MRSMVEGAAAAQAFVIPGAPKANPEPVSFIVRIEEHRFRISASLRPE